MTKGIEQRWYTFTQTWLSIRQSDNQLQYALSFQITTSTLSLKIEHTYQVSQVCYKCQHHKTPWET